MLILIVTVLLEVLLYSILWRLRRHIAVLTILLIGLGSVVLIALDQTLWITGLLLINLFRVINLARINKARMHEHYLYKVCRRSSALLILVSIAYLLLVSLLRNVGYLEIWVIVASFQLCAAILMVAVTARNIFKTEHHQATQFFSDKELPTVTVAIPARNETADLTSCLTSILATDYPKIEVLVLDDCSQDKTSEIIKAFAHDGVRFLKGSEPKERWLAKNQAYEQLAKAASGEYIIFCGVDVRFGPETIRSLMTTALHKRRTMMSVLPHRLGGSLRSSVIQPMRYWWELSLPRRFFNRPAVLSTCWLIKRDELEKRGGFAAVSHSIIPEGYFARELVKEDKYAFIRADEHLDIRTVKEASQQFELALRMRYPQLRRRPENVLLLISAELAALLFPFLTLLSSFWMGLQLQHWISLVAIVLIIYNHAVIVASTNPSHSLIALFNFPLVIITELVIAVRSMYDYEFGMIDWKGRNVCIPVMHVIPQDKFLPKN